MAAIGGFGQAAAPFSFASATTGAATGTGFGAGGAGFGSGGGSFGAVGAAPSFGGGGFGAGGFGAPAQAGAFGMAVGAPAAQAVGAQLGLLKLPQVPDMHTLETLEDVLDSGPSDPELKKENDAFGADGNKLKSGLIVPFLLGFEERKVFDEGLKSDELKLALAKEISSRAEKIFEDCNPATPGVRMVKVTQSFESDFEKVGLSNMKGREIPKAEIEPWLKLASEIALELRENLVRCLHLVLTAKSQAVPGDDDHALKENAVRIYYNQQQRILTIICRTMTTNEQLQTAPQQPSELFEKQRDFYRRVCEGAILKGPPAEPTFCDRVCRAVEYNLERYTDGVHASSICDSSTPFYRQKRRGVEMEMRILCELLLERLRSSEPAGVKDGMTKVLGLYMRFAGHMKVAGQLEPGSDSSDGKTLCIIFYGTMLASAISYAVLDPDRTDHGPQKEINEWLVANISQDQPEQKSEIGKLGLLSPSLSAEPIQVHLQQAAGSRPSVGYMQLVLACSRSLGKVGCETFRKLAVYNQALSFLDRDMLVCLAHDRWADYRDRIAKSCGFVLKKILESQVLTL